MPYPGRRKPPLPTPPNGFKSDPPTSGYVGSSVERKFRGCVAAFGLEGLVEVVVVVDELIETCYVMSCYLLYVVFYFTYYSHLHIQVCSIQESIFVKYSTYKS